MHANGPVSMGISRHVVASKRVRVPEVESPGLCGKLPDALCKLLGAAGHHPAKLS